MNNIEKIKIETFPMIKDKRERMAWEKMLIVGSTTDDRLIKDTKDDELANWKSIQAIITGLKTAKFFVNPVDAQFGQIVDSEFKAIHGHAKAKDDKYIAVTSNLVDRKINAYHKDDWEW